MRDDVVGKYETNHAWELVNSIPRGRRVTKGEWVYRVVYKSDGTVDKFKARWVACGYSQIEGINYDETFCSTIRLESIQIFLADMCRSGYDWLEIDVTKAFTQGDMDKSIELYVQQPRGFEQTGYVACRLTKPLEGTKQAGNFFMKSNAEHLKKLGFERCDCEPNLFKRTRHSILIKMGLYVDNLIIRFSRGDKAARAQIDVFLKEYTARFKCSEHVVPELFCGMKVDRDFEAKTLKLSMGHYIKEVVSRRSPRSSSTPRPSPSPRRCGRLRSTRSSSWTSRPRTRRRRPCATSYLSIMGCLLPAVDSDDGSPRHRLPCELPVPGDAEPVARGLRRLDRRPLIP